jgi:hypothetical protein
MACIDWLQYFRAAGRERASVQQMDWAKIFWLTNRGGGAL